MISFLKWSFSLMKILRFMSLQCWSGHTILIELLAESILELIYHLNHLCFFAFFLIIPVKMLIQNFPSRN